MHVSKIWRTKRNVHDLGAVENNWCHHPACNNSKNIKLQSYKRCTVDLRRICEDIWGQFVTKYISSYLNKVFCTYQVKHLIYVLINNTLHDASGCHGWNIIPHGMPDVYWCFIHHVPVWQDCHTAMAQLCFIWGSRTHTIANSHLVFLDGLSHSLLMRKWSLWGHTFHTIQMKGSLYIYD